MPSASESPVTATDTLSGTGSSRVLPGGRRSEGNSGMPTWASTGPSGGALSRGWACAAAPQNRQRRARRRGSLLVMSSTNSSTSHYMSLGMRILRRERSHKWNHETRLLSFVLQFGAIPVRGRATRRAPHLVRLGDPADRIHAAVDDDGGAGHVAAEP